jgi:glycosyltransferase involved in cell wall biosynthesis
VLRPQSRRGNRRFRRIWPTGHDARAVRDASRPDPSYNPGPIVNDTVGAALKVWNPVWVVVDGSTDGSASELLRIAETTPALHVIELPENRGKGAAVLRGIDLAAEEGFTHVLTMDSDGQHPAGADSGIHGGVDCESGRDGARRPGLSPRTRRASASRAARSRTGGRISRRCGWGSAIRCSAFACIRSGN